MHFAFSPIEPIQALWDTRNFLQGLPRKNFLYLIT